MVDSMIYVPVYRAQRLSSSINAVAQDLASMRLVPTRCEAIPSQRGLDRSSALKKCVGTLNSSRGCDTAVVLPV